MNPTDPFRELTPEEAEQAWADAPEESVSEEQMASLLRKTMILIGAVPLAEMTPDECWWHLCHVTRFSRSRRSPGT